MLRYDRLRSDDPEIQAYAALMEAAKGLDELCYGSDLSAWHRYQRAYYAWVEVVRS